MSEQEERKTPTQSVTEFQRLMTPRIILLVTLAYGGMFLAASAFIKIPILPMLEKYGLPLLGFGISFLSMLFLMEEMKKRRLLRDEKFVDVDVRSREAADGTYHSILAELRELRKSSADRLDLQRIEALVTQSTAVVAPEEKTTETFTTYFTSIRKIIEQKANVADEKASILLDKGTSYSRWGIWFFLFSITTWQMLSWVHGFQVQFIYGIASCSVLFIFIEFLSAWFLRQYRHFVDTSTYLIKVKSIFDRYMLCYLATCEFTDSVNNKDRDKFLHELLSGDIKWPDTYLFKSADISFAKEALETMSLFANNMKTQIKEKPKKEKDED